MKLFANLDEFWKYCSYCPLCKDNCRKVKIDIGPEPVIQLNGLNHDTKENKMSLYTTYKDKTGKYDITFDINCLTNHFDVSIEKNTTSDTVYFSGKADQPFFYIYLQSYCNICHRANTYTDDLELNMLDRKICNLVLDRETFVLDEMKLDVFFNNDDISWPPGIVITSNKKKIKIPLFDLDLSDQEKAIEKLKSYILFS